MDEYRDTRTMKPITVESLMTQLRERDELLGRCEKVIGTSKTKEWKDAIKLIPDIRKTLGVKG